MTLSLAGKTAIVTGASSGIGRAAARALVKEGVQVALVARSKDKLDALARELGPQTLAVPADLTIAAEIDAMVETVAGAFGQIDILFANAGSYVPGVVAEGDADQWDAMLSVNVNSIFRAIRAVLPGMIARRTGEIVVTSSISGHQALHWEPVYSASKHAVQAFVHGLRRQVAPHNIRVGSLAPGIVLNELWGISDPDEIERKVAAHEGLRSEDVADALLFMLTRPANATVRDLVLLPQNQDI